MFLLRRNQVVDLRKQELKKLSQSELLGKDEGPFLKIWLSL